ncbi:thiamine pyrophosphate-binding protein [Streptomyces sp. NPDC056069]|uniref:thiamine pyrophosphate-binding protein n=1 Tax=Streptomyces sp. NPDC056069 TaxID=3345702 RepID=UPI0035E137FD
MDMMPPLNASPEDSTPGHSNRLVDVALHHLRRQGITTIFGIPGGLIHPFFDRVEQDAEFSVVVARHEGGAAFMADGFARTSGRIAVAAATSGPGATNLLTGVAAAYADGVPMLVITGQAPSHTLGRGAAQETAREDIDIVGIFRPVTKYSAMVPSPQQFSLHFRRAITLAVNGRPGPVHLNVPVDFWQCLVDEPLADFTAVDSSRPVDLPAIEQAAALLARAQHTVMLVGSGASSLGARRLVEEVATCLDAPTATTPRAKGVFPEDHPLSLGVCGLAGSPAAQLALMEKSVDTLLVVGASMNETTTFNWHPGIGHDRHIIQLDIDPVRIGRNYPVDVALVGDAEATLAELLKHLQAHTSSPRPAEAAIPGAGNILEMTKAPEVSPEKILGPDVWRAEFNCAIPSDAIVFSDIGGHMLFNLRHLCMRNGQRFILNMGFGSMGHGTVAPIGASLGCPGTPIIAIVGDACFAMNGMELLTAREYDIPVVWIVENNQSHGISYHGSKLVNGGRAMQCIVNKKMVSAAAIAGAMGIPSWQVDQPGQIDQILNQALAVSGPAVIEVHVDPEVSPPLAERARTVAGFRNN